MNAFSEHIGGQENALFTAVDHGSIVTYAL
jgi:hypothetical protein